ncbi:MAG: hypothetical protein H3C47_08255 [Candidatus Cloacimonetes bacterium]|nr:hypothetical protein [Candidatus Cloacimonadota bacterium]
MSQSRASRSNYFIQAGLQIRFTFVLVLIVVLVSMITFVNLYVIGDYVVSNTATIVDLRDMQSFMKTIFEVVGWRIMLVGVVCFMIICIIGIFFSHRFAGPSFKLEKCLKEMSLGNLSFDIRLRNGDALHNVADSVNFLVDRFRSVIGQSREISVNLREICASVPEEQSQKLLEKIGQLEDLLAGFQISREEADRNGSEPADSE